MAEIGNEASARVMDEYNLALNASWEERRSTFRRLIDLAGEDAGVDLSEVNEAIDAALESSHRAGFIEGTAFGMQQGTAFAAQLTIPSRRR